VAQMFTHYIRST